MPVGSPLLHCEACDLDYSHEAPPPVEPTGIEYLDRYHALCGAPSGDWLDDFNSFRIESYTLRRDLVKHFSWAVPNEAALTAIGAQGPIVEMGAGGGYWAMLLRERGVDVIAYDAKPEGNHHVEKSGWTQVEAGTPTVLKRHADRALFLCWPPYDDSMAHASLLAYKGKTVIYIGEAEGGCTADDAFFRKLNREYKHDEEIYIPHWDGIHDYLSIWQRK